MNFPWHRFQNQILRLFEYLLLFYPPYFRDEFSIEIKSVLLSRLSESDKRGKVIWLSTAFQEITALIYSIFRECWHEFRVRKEITMVPEDQIQREASTEGGGPTLLRPAVTPGLGWLAGWTLLTTAAIPAAMIAMSPIAVLFLWLINLGIEAGFWPSTQGFIPELLGFTTSFAFALAAAQWYMLRRFLPETRLWFLTTMAVLLFCVLVVGLSLSRSDVTVWNPLWFMVAVLLPIGLALGLAQWFYLRRFLPNAYWIIFINLLAAGSILLVGEKMTSLFEIIIFVLPGAITGLGMMLLIKQDNIAETSRRRIAVERDVKQQFPRFVRVGILVVALVPMFFACIWAYTSAQLTLAKNEGIYSTVEEAVIEGNSRSFGGAEVTHIEEIQVGPNSRDSQPHVWFGTAKVYLDRVPTGRTWDHYYAGSYYIRVREGWVHVSEGAFPEFIGWVMEFYNMEGLDG